MLISHKAEVKLVLYPEEGGGIRLLLKDMLQYDHERISTFFPHNYPAL